MSVCVVCQQLASVYCENDKAYLCAQCDEVVHTANCVVAGHIRKPVSAQLTQPKRNSYEKLMEIMDRRSSFNVDLEDFLGGGEQDCFTNILEGNMMQTKDWEDKLDIGLQDWMLQEEAVGENLDKMQSQPKLHFPCTDNLNPFTVTTGTTEYQTNFSPAMVPCFSATSHPSIDSSDIHPDYSNVFNMVPQHNAVSSPSMKKVVNTNNVGKFQFPEKATPEERAAKIARYRAKRERRNFQKKIRYQTRKAYAEIRPRVKGRFAKRTDTTETTMSQDLFEQFMVPDTAFAVVP